MAICAKSRADCNGLRQIMRGISAARIFTRECGYGARNKHAQGTPARRGTRVWVLLARLAHAFKQ